MKENIKELIKQYLTLIYEASENGADALINQLVRKIMQSLTPSVSDEEIKRDIKREAELYQSDPAKTSFEISRAEYFAFCEGAKWMRDNHLPSKGEEIIFTDMELLAIIDHANSKGHITVKKNQHIVELILRALSLSKDTPQKSDELVVALKYMISVWDEVTGKTWRETPDHVQQMFLEAEQALNKAGSDTNQVQ